MPSDVASSIPAPASASDESPPSRDSSPAAAPHGPVDALLRSILSGAQGRVDEDLARAREAGLLDAEGRLITDRWPDDMKESSRSSVETG